MSRKALTALAFALLLTGISKADDHPMEAPGFVADKLYDFHGIDSVNTFNGNMIARIPIGPTFHVNGQLSYGLVLHYNSKLWKFTSQILDEDGCSIDPIGCQRWPSWATSAKPARRFNAALGWSLSLGRLYRAGINNPYGIEPGTYTYEDPDGATHVFRFPVGATSVNYVNTLYTRDGSFMRARLAEATETSSTVTIDSRDGVSRQFAWENNTYHLKSISDAAGNVVTISYNLTNPLYEIWTISDDVRAQSPIVVTFSRDSTLTGTYLDTVLQSVQLPSPSGGTTLYTFSTPMAKVTLPQDVSNPGQIDVPFLTVVKRPSGGNYVMTTDGTESGTPAYKLNDSEGPGCLARLRLPTGGVIEWTYLEILVEKERQKVNGPGIEKPAVVVKRTVTDSQHASRTPATWLYEYGGEVLDDCLVTPKPRVRRVTVTRPDGNKEVSYYELTTRTTQCTSNRTNTAWNGYEYGLPFARWRSNTDPTDSTGMRQQFLSSQLLDANNSVLQSRYVFYEGDAPAVLDSTTPNSRVRYETTYWDCDDSASGHQCDATKVFTTTRHDNYQGFGNFGDSLVTGSYKAASGALATSSRASHQVFRGAINESGTNSRWLPDIVTEECTADGVALSACSSSVFTTYSNYDLDKNQLLNKRVLSGSAVPANLAANDILTSFTYDSRGNLVSESYAGGDCAAGTTTNCNNLSTADKFALPQQSRYTIVHTRDAAYQNSGITTTLTSRYKKSDGTLFNATISDFTLEPRSGVIMRSRDSAGLESAYEYDAIGRLKKVVPAGAAATTYTYNDGATPVSVEARTESGGAVLKQAHYDYDGMGRLWREGLFVNDQYSTKTTRYDDLSRVWRTSQVEASHADGSAATDCDDSDLSCTETTYDALGRTAQFRDPSGYWTAFTYDGPHKTTKTVAVNAKTCGTNDSNCAQSVELTDAFGRLISVTDPVSTKGVYAYDAADHLISATVSDMTGNSQLRSFTYDKRGFLTAETHPESGTANYAYDVRGHVVSKRVPGATGFDVDYQYDDAERLLTLLSGTTSSMLALKSFTYGDAASDPTVVDEEGSKINHQRGKLTVATRHNRQGSSDVTVTETYQYLDAAGRLTRRITDIALDNVLKKSITQATAFNDLGLPEKTRYPYCASCGAANWDILSRGYVEGRPDSIPGFASKFTYGGNGMLIQIDHSDLSVDAMTPDGKLPRPLKIEVSREDCGGIQITSQPMDQTVASNQSATFRVSATGSGSLSVQWFKSGDSTVLGTDWAFTTPALTAPATYYYAKITMTLTCAGQQTTTTQNSSVVTAFVEACSKPAIQSKSPNVTIGYAQSTTLSVTATGAQSYAWVQVDNGITYPNAPTISTGGLTQSAKFHVTVTNQCGSVTSADIIVFVVPPSPTAIKATLSGTSVTVNWTRSTGSAIARQELESLSRGAWTRVDQPLGSTDSSISGLTLNSNPLGGVNAAAYRIRAVETIAIDATHSVDVISPYSNVCFVTNATFSTLPADALIVANPLTEVLNAVDGVNQLVWDGTPKLTWGVLNVPTPATTADIKRDHIAALRAKMDDVVTRAGATKVTYSDPGLPAGTPLRKLHITELQKQLNGGN